MIIIGIDPSLTGTGVAIVDTQDILAPATFTVASSGRKGDSVWARRERLGKLERSIEDYCIGLHVSDGQTADLVTIEAPAYDSRTGHQHDRSGLWWLLVDRLFTLGIPVAEVTTGGVKKYATGKGNASKDAVLLAVARRFAHVDVTDNNQADALVLAAMGARHIGQPIDEMPKAHHAALDAVHWPELGRRTTAAALPPVYRGTAVR